MWLYSVHFLLAMHHTLEDPREGQALDIDPEAGKDRVGARRDKGHRYLRFETQVGRFHTPDR